MKKKFVQSIHPPPVAGQACQSVIQTSYDIVKAHGGELKVETKQLEGLPAGSSIRNVVKEEASALAGSMFIIQLPMYQM